jgi:hypothetical protein
MKTYVGVALEWTDIYSIETVAGKQVGSVAGLHEMAKKKYLSLTGIILQSSSSKRSHCCDCAISASQFLIFKKYRMSENGVKKSYTEKYLLHRKSELRIQLHKTLNNCHLVSFSVSTIMI